MMTATLPGRPGKLSMHPRLPSGTLPSCQGAALLGWRRHDSACDRHDCGGQGVISVTSNVVPSLMSSLMLRKQPQLDDRCICSKISAGVCCTPVTGHCLASDNPPDFTTCHCACLVVVVCGEPAWWVCGPGQHMQCADVVQQTGVPGQQGQTWARLQVTKARVLDVLRAQPHRPQHSPGHVRGCAASFQATVRAAQPSSA